MMTYKEARRFIEDSGRYGSILGLDTIRELLKKLQNPEKLLTFIHVGGTNGKGSTAAYISSMLAEAGYLIGRYISPTIFAYREKIQIQDIRGTHYICEDSLARAIDKIKIAIDEMIKEGFTHPTQFEIETAMAFLEFVDKKCDYVVIEVGMGGRMDATNVIQNTVCAVLTSISMDHMQFLGDSLEKITYEKAGIIKSGCKVISYDQTWENDYPERNAFLKGSKEPMEVIAEQCNQIQVPLIVTDFTKLHHIEHTLNGVTFDYKEFKDLKVSLLGECQPYNAVLALETVLALGKCGVDHIYKGLAKTIWKGRFEVISKDPFLIVDGAHNEGAARSLEKSIQYYLADKCLIFVVGMLADKDYESVFRYTGKYAEKIITITPNNSRGLDSKILQETISKYGKEVIDGHTIQEGISLAKQWVQEEDQKEKELYRKNKRENHESEKFELKNMELENNKLKNQELESNQLENFKSRNGILVFGSLSFLGELYNLLF